MKEQLEQLKAQALKKIEESKDLNALNDVRVSILGKKGELTNILKSMKDVAKEDRPKVGAMVNDVREAIEEKLRIRKEAFEAAVLEMKMASEAIDVTLPAKKQAEGDNRESQEIAVEYNDTVIYPDKVRLNCYYYRHYSFIKDIQLIFCTVLGKNTKYTK